MICLVLLPLVLEKPAFNPKGYCAKFCPNGRKKAPSSYYCCDSDHLYPEPKGLFDAAKNKDVRWIQYFIENGNYINEFNEHYYNYTPLHISALNSNIEIAKMLIENGADINSNAKNNLQPIHVAALNNNLELIKLLIKNGANINAKDQFNRSPLHLATFKKNCEIIDYLLNNGADYYETLKFGNNFPVYYNSFEIAKYTQDNRFEKSCLPNFYKHDPIKKWLTDNNFDVDEYQPIITALGIIKINDINKFKNIDFENLFNPIEWSLNYSWLPTSFLCTPNCSQHKINIFRLINQ